MLFLFFSILGEWGGWVLESMENSILFFEPFPKWEKKHYLKLPRELCYVDVDAMAVMQIRVKYKVQMKMFGLVNFLVLFWLISSHVDNV